MIQQWFRPRTYKHFDVAVNASFAEGCTPAFVKAHSWSPHIHFIKEVKRYRPNDHKVVMKERDIMYASHRDACILSKYAYDLSQQVEQLYDTNGLTECVIGYRKLGKANYNFSADALAFAKANAPCVVQCFDIKKFFDRLDHGILKARLKKVLKVKGLSDDWFAVYRQVTKFSVVERDDLAAHPVFGKRMLNRRSPLIATMAEVTAAKITIRNNTTSKGIPQGTPISAILANLYLADLDAALNSACTEKSALYRRYSDDIIIICKPEHEAMLTATFRDQIAAHQLELSEDKSERIDFHDTSDASIQYLGFQFSKFGPTIRSSSMSRQWRKLRRDIKRAKQAGEAAMAKGLADKVFTQKLRKRFSSVGARNFPSYANRSAEAFKSPRIKRQARRIERVADALIRGLNPDA